MTEESYLEGLKNKTISFCHQLDSSGLRRSKAMAGFLLSLSSNTSARSPVALSLNACFQHKYSSIFDVINSVATTKKERKHAQRKVRRICFNQFVDQTEHQPGDRINLSIDVTPCVKPFSPTLEDRQAIVVPNPGPHQKFRLEEGYNLSFVNLGNFDDKWSLPLDARRVGVEQTSSACGLAQINTLLNDSHLGLNQSLVVLNADNGYANVPFLQPLYEQHHNLVVVARPRKGSKTYTQVGPPSDGSYHRKFYGQVHYNILHSDVKNRKRCGKDNETYPVIRTSISEAGADETLNFKRKMGRGQREVDVIVERFNDRLLKSKGGLMMKDKPVDILRIQYLNPETQQGIYRHEMYLILSGERRGELSSKEAQQSYVSRSDLEAFFRVSKQRMLLESFQTCQLSHLDNYLLLIQLASWMSYLTAAEATRCINPWEKNAKQEAATPGQRLSMAQSIRAASAYYATLDLSHLSPPQCTGGKGRKKGTKLAPRKQHKRVRKRPIKG